MTLDINNLSFSLSDASTVLGVGSQAQLLKGTNKKDGKEVVVKVFQNANIDKISSEFRREYNALQILKGKSNICQSVGIHVDNDCASIGLEKFDCDLFSYAFESGNQLNEAEIIPIFRKICNGVANMHQSGIAHLDLKPENILIRNNAQDIAICDFGMCHISESKIRTVVNVRARGTIQYIAPELALSPRSFNPYAADIFSLGCLLFVLVTSFFPNRNEEGKLILADQVCISAECAEFINYLLDQNAKRRPTIEKVLEHPFLQLGCQKTKPKSEIRKLPQIAKRKSRLFKRLLQKK